LEWWKVNEGTYPRLAQVAKDVLAVQIAQVGVERVFNVAKDVIGNRRHHLAARTIQQIMVLKQTITEEADQPIDLSNTSTAEDQEPYDEIDDLFELPAKVELPASFERAQSVDQDLWEADTVDNESPLPPRKRARPARYCD